MTTMMMVNNSASSLDCMYIYLVYGLVGFNGHVLS